MGSSCGLTELLQLTMEGSSDPKARFYREDPEEGRVFKLWVGPNPSQELLFRCVVSAAIVFYDIGLHSDEETYKSAFIPNVWEKFKEGPHGKREDVVEPIMLWGSRSTETATL